MDPLVVKRKKLEEERKTLQEDLVKIFGPWLARQALPLSLDLDLTEPERVINLQSETISEFGSKDARREQAKDFLRVEAKGHFHYPVIKSCTWSGDEKLWSDKCLGITWVALHGMDSLCVVVRSNHLLHLQQTLLKSPDSDEITTFLQLFWNFLVSEVEDIEERLLGQGCMRPFSVVTVGATGEDCISGYEDSRDAMYRAEQTSKFLQEKLKIDPSLSSDKTVQTAIMATQHLFNKKFEADEIRVFVWEKNEIIGKELQQKRDIPDLHEILARMDRRPNSHRIGATRSHGASTPTGKF